jgi:hypothetical protein
MAQRGQQEAIRQDCRPVLDLGAILALGHDGFPYIVPCTPDALTHAQGDR